MQVSECVLSIWLTPYLYDSSAHSSQNRRRAARLGARYLSWVSLNNIYKKIKISGAHTSLMEVQRRAEVVTTSPTYLGRYLGIFRSRSLPTLCIASSHRIANLPAQIADQEQPSRISHLAYQIDHLMHVRRRNPGYRQNLSNLSNRSCIPVLNRLNQSMISVFAQGRKPPMPVVRLDVLQVSG